MTNLKTHLAYIFTALTFLFYPVAYSQQQGYMQSNDLTMNETGEKGFEIIAEISDQRQHLEIFSEQENPALLISQNKIISEKIFYYAYDKNGIIDSVLKKQVFYETNGNISRVDNYRNGKIFSQVFNTYNKNGFRIKSELTYIGGNLRSKQISQYEYNGFDMETIRYEYNGDTTTLDTYQSFYDSLGLCIKVNRTYNNHEPQLRHEYFYDEQERLVRKSLQFNQNYVYEYLGNPVKVVNIYLQVGSKKKKQESYFLNDKLQIEKVEKWAVGINLNPKSMEAKDVFGSEEKKTVTNLYYNRDGTLLQKTNSRTNGMSTMQRHFYYK